MASFQAKKGWIRTRKSENKNCISVPFRSVPTRREIQNFKKREKNKKMPLWLHFKPKLDGKGRLKRENKNYCFVSFRPDALEKIREQ